MPDILNFTYQIQDVEQVAKTVLDNLDSKTVLFAGDLGVGKTTLIKAMVKQLGSFDTVSSPTFSLVNEYESEQGLIYHFDFYRIENEEEALQFGIEDYLSSDAWLFMEWPDRIPGLLPEEANVVTIKHHDNTSRALKLTKKPNITLKQAMEPQNF